MEKAVDFSKGKRGAVVPTPGKTRITIWVDTDIIEHFRALSEVTPAVVRKIVREELART